MFLSIAVPAMHDIEYQLVENKVLPGVVHFRTFFCALADKLGWKVNYFLPANLCVFLIVLLQKIPVCL